MPAALCNDINMEEVGMIEEEEEFQEMENLVPMIEKDEVVQECSQSEGNEDLDVHEKEINEDHNGQHGELLGEDLPAALAPSESDSLPFPELTEETIKIAIMELLEENSLSQGEPLKVWKQAIALKIKYPSGTLPKSWNETILVQLQLISELSTPEREEVPTNLSQSEDDDNNTSPVAEEEASPEAESINEELAVVQALQKAVVSKRTTAVLELLQRDEEEIELKAGQLRSSLLQRVKQRTQPQVDHFRREINALKDVKRVMKAEGLLDAFTVIAQEKGITLDDEDSEEDECEEEDGPDQKGGDGMIALSDDDEQEDAQDGESESESESERESVAHEVETSLLSKAPSAPSLCGGRIKSVVRVGGNSARLSLKTQLQQKSLLQSSEMVAKRFGLTNSHELVTVLGGMELERRRLAAKRAEIESEMAEKERKIALDRKERARKFQEELALRADDSEGEFDEKDETFAVTAVAISETAIPPVELGDDQDSEEEDEDKDQEMDEEEELSILQQLQSQEEAEEAEAEKEGSDSEEEGESEEEEEQTQREDAEPAEGLKSAKTKEPPSDLALSPSEEALQATQVDEVESMLEEQTATAVTSVPVLTQQPSTSISNSSEKPAAVKKAKNSIYAQLLLDEERQAKKQKTTPGSKFLETEAEEDEEEGRQAGLGDFGFVIHKTHEDEDEAALKLRATDLENIVDDLSDGEGDEEEGDRQRLQEEARQDRMKTKRILEALANGQKGANRRGNDSKTRGLYGMDELVAGDIAEMQSQKRSEEEEGGGADGDLDFDDDEELQARYLNEMKSRIRGQRQDASGAIDELSDEEEEDEDLLDEGAKVASLTPEERAQKAKIAAIEKENYRRYFEQALRNRALRMSSKRMDEPSGAVIAPSPLGLGLPQMLRTSSVKEAEALPFPVPQLSRAATTSISKAGPPSLTTTEVPVTREGGELKRRVSMPPRKVESQNGRIPRVRSTNSNPQPGKKASAAKSDFTGVLTREEMEAGHGMFMGVSLSKRRRATEESSSNSGSLFSDVTNRGGGSGNSSQGAKRSFSSVISRRQSLNSVGGSAITVSSSQFVFLEDSSRTVNSSHHEDHDASSGMEGSLSRQTSGGASRKRQIPSEESSSGGGLKRSKTLPSGGSGSSLFDKLVERAGPVLSGHGKTPAASTSHSSSGKKLLLAAGRIRSN